MPTTSRRSFLQWATCALGAVGTVLTAIPLVGYLTGALRKTSAPWVNLGLVTKYPVGETRLETFDNPIRQPWDGTASLTGVHVRNLGNDKFLVFAINCTHLGCPVTWFPQSGLFMCPCHGGAYYEDGEHASGPPPRGLYQCLWRLRSGNLEIQAPHLPTLQDTFDDKA